MAGRKFGITLAVPELGEALKKISSYDGKSRLGIEKAVQNSTQAIKVGAKSRVPVRTGGLKKSIVAKFDVKGPTGYVKARKPHAHLVEFGAKAAHEQPDTKKALKIPFRGLGVSKDYYSSGADIPARRERPYMRPSFENEKPSFIKKLAEAVKKVD